MPDTATDLDKNLTSDFFHRYAADFNDIYGTRKGLIQDMINCIFRRSMRLRYEYSLAACQPAQGKTILDVGCGPGHYSVALAQDGASRVLGIDFAPAMIEIAKAKAEAFAVIDKCEFSLADFMDMEEKEQFDHVILMGFMDYIAEPRAVVEKAIRLCKNSVLLSFPSSAGILAKQRKLRYRKRCPLYLYSYRELQHLLGSIPGILFKIRKIDRDYWVQIRVLELSQ